MLLPARLLAPPTIALPALNIKAPPSSNVPAIAASVKASLVTSPKLCCCIPNKLSIPSSKY